MKVDGINSSQYFDRINSNRKTVYQNTTVYNTTVYNTQESTESNFAGNLAESTLNHQSKSENQMEEVNGKRSVNYPTMASGISASGIEKSSIMPCRIQNITYQESDNVKICIEDGCVYKAKVYEERNVIYIEKKSEDGTIEAFEANIEAIDKTSKNPVELMAAETYEKYKNGKSSSVEENFAAALIEFQQYVKDRIENGPPKFLIGSMEASIEEWDELLENVDEAIDEIKEEMRERIEKLEQSDEEKAEQEGGILNGYQD